MFSRTGTPCDKKLWAYTRYEWIFWVDSRSEVGKTVVARLQAGWERREALDRMDCRFLAESPSSTAYAGKICISLILRHTC